MLYLSLEAPFATFRTFTAGSFRPTAPFITPSAAYGLLLNLAGIEMRDDDGRSVMTLIRSGLPVMRIALGAVSLPEQHSIYQQIHNYPVGSTGKEHAARTKGGKYNIVPTRRAFLTDLKAMIGVQAETPLEGRIQAGLAGKEARDYGLPFVGDNNFLPSRLETLAEPKAAHWFVPVGKDADTEQVRNPARLTLSINRDDMSRTKSTLFYPLPDKQSLIPDEAWVRVDYS